MEKFLTLAVMASFICMPSYEENRSLNNNQENAYYSCGSCRDRSRNQENTEEYFSCPCKKRRGNRNHA